MYMPKEGRVMKTNMNVKGTDRKALAARIAELTDQEVKYLGVPSCSYKVGEFILTKDGFLETENDEAGEKLMKKLEAKEEPETTGHLEIALPADTLTAPQMELLRGIIASKSELIKKAFGAESTEIRVADGKITFPWFPIDSDADSNMAYMLFVTKLCSFAKDHKRVNSGRQAEPENEKYTFRCFLLRLGFIGDYYKGARKILLRNLTGSSAFLHGKKDAEL